MPGYPSLVELLGLIVSFREVSAAVSDMGHEAGPGPTCPMPYQGFYPLFKIILVEPQRATVDQSKVRKSVRTAIAGGWTALSAVEDTILVTMVDTWLRRKPHGLAAVARGLQVPRSGQQEILT
ncbi:hypothetical protein CCM_06208 [Cordyceps militaris CM01]|uniref:Uncharacterized protein n=1 Tax=Cordyceps militaris (strain CM01) TaxID=983644 RepID=G3JJG0_CORMM|nr:uncharacterized protein CCM_06208 [Cordyceps militaris CM01]EGX92048.1 hypothetical protein CCM_06208 [Cordyceps militaris CM01]